MDIGQEGARPGPAGQAARPFEVTRREVLRVIVPMTPAFLTTPLLGITDTAVIGRHGVLLVPRFGNHGLWFALQVFLSMRGFALLAATPAKRRRTFAA